MYVINIRNETMWEKFFIHKPGKKLITIKIFWKRQILYNISLDNIFTII